MLFHAKVLRGVAAGVVVGVNDWVIARNFYDDAGRVVGIERDYECFLPADRPTGLPARMWIPACNLEFPAEVNISVRCG